MKANNGCRVGNFSRRICSCVVLKESLSYQTIKSKNIVMCLYCSLVIVSLEVKLGLTMPDLALQREWNEIRYIPTVFIGHSLCAQGSVGLIDIYFQMVCITEHKVQQTQVKTNKFQEDQHLGLLEHSHLVQSDEGIHADKYFKMIKLSIFYYHFWRWVHNSWHVFMRSQWWIYNFLLIYSAYW